MNEIVKIGTRRVGGGAPVLIVAEIGSNHDAKLEQAKQMIAVAAGAGVDAVKFQLFSADVLYPNHDGPYALMKANELPRAWLPELAACAREHGLIFLASPFDTASVDALVEVGTPAIKLASSEVTNLPLMSHAAATGLPLIIATGMCDLKDVQTAVETAAAAGNREIVLLQCASLYPAGARQVNLRAMDTLRVVFELPVGFSDHTPGHLIAAAAVARGACLVEKHITLSRDLDGPDHGYALEPGEVAALVSALRDVEASLGSAFKDILPEERPVARRESVTARVGIPAGTPVTGEMLTVQRPATGIRPRYLGLVVGRTARRDIAAGEPVTWDML
jgi:sialic acid synthase SpsE